MEGEHALVGPMHFCPSEASGTQPVFAAESQCGTVQLQGGTADAVLPVRGQLTERLRLGEPRGGRGPGPTRAGVEPEGVANP